MNIKNNRIFEYNKNISCRISCTTTYQKLVMPFCFESSYGPEKKKGLKKTWEKISNVFPHILQWRDRSVESHRKRRKCFSRWRLVIKMYFTLKYWKFIILQGYRKLPSF